MCHMPLSRRLNDDESSLLSTFLGFSVFSSVSHPATLQNLVTKDLATEVIQESLLRAKVLGQQEVKKFVQDRLIVAEQCDKPDVSIYEPVRKNNAPTFATLYQLANVAKHTKDRDQKTVMKADRNVLRRLITFYEAGRSVDLASVLKHELLPVPVSLAEMNGTLRTGNKSELANVVTEDIDCPETIQLHATSSLLIIDGQALVVALGKPDAAVTFGDLADIYVKTVLKAGSEYHIIMLCSTDTGKKQSRVRPERGAVKQHVQSDGLWKVVMYLYQRTGRMFCHWLITKQI